MKQGDRAVWNSAKGYSKPGEIVTVQEVREGYQHGGTGPVMTIALITSAPDGPEEMRASPEGFSQWVPVSELAPYPLTVNSAKGKTMPLSYFQDGPDFYCSGTDCETLIASYPHFVKNDYDVAGANAARAQFLKDYPQWAGRHESQVK